MAATALTIPDTLTDLSAEHVAEAVRAVVEAQAEAGSLAAELMGREHDWARVLPAVADIASAARRLADAIEGGAAHSQAALAADAPVPAVVWARELGVTQRLVRAAIRRLTERAQGSDAMDRAALVPLTEAARELRVRVREMAGVNWAVGA